MVREFARIAIVNRGEAAMRLINAVRELGRERGRDIRTIALHTKAEQRAMFVREADEAVCLDDGRAADAASPYLDLEMLEQALRTARADAAWVGWGFVAERPEFAELCERLGVAFVGPSADVMRLLGDKIGAKLLAEQAGVPVAAWSGGAVGTLGDAERHAAAIGYPLMIKATAGGGGRGIRKVTAHAELAAAFESARTEGLKAFGDATVFMERVVADARHVEVQIIGDDYGTVWAVGVRDCTMQRRNQKVIEESHSTALSAEQDHELRIAAVRLAMAAGYRNAGTVEFLYQPNEERFAFLEVNTRLQVEHPVTEMTTGLDLVKLQLHVAEGGRLEGDPPASFGHAIEARLNAEDPNSGFAPAPGSIEVFTVPVGPGVRVDTGVSEGDVIPPEYDSMIAKIIAWGMDRDEARSRLWRALSQTTVIVEGGTTNKAFLLDLLDRPEMRTGDIDTGWLDRLTSTAGFAPTRNAEIALIAAAIDAYDDEALSDQDRFFGWASRGRPQARSEIGHDVELRHSGHGYRVEVRRCGPDVYDVELAGRPVTVAKNRFDRVRSRLAIGARQFRIVSSKQRSDRLIEVDGVAHRFSSDDGGLVRASAGALVVAVHVAPGDLVEAGTAVAVVEAMKLEIAVAAPVGGRVREVLVTPNMQVDAGAPLLRIEALVDESAVVEASPRLTFAHLHDPEAGDDVQRCLGHLDRLRSLMLGMDIERSQAQERVTAYRRDRQRISSPQPRLDGAELEVIAVFADICAVTRDRRSEGDFEALSSPSEHFNGYLRAIDIDPDQLPEHFRSRLLGALAHYGIVSLAPSAGLREALYRIFVSHKRRADQIPVIKALLDRQLADPRSGRDRPDVLRDLLERLIDATQRRHPAVAGLARSIRHRCFDQPIIDHARDEVRSAAIEQLELLASTHDGPEREWLVEALVSCPQPLVPIVAAENALADAAAPGALLEVLTRRYYKIRSLENIRVEGSAGRQLLHARYIYRDRNVHVIAARARPSDLNEVVQQIAVACAEIDPSETAVVDIYLVEPTTSQGDADLIAAEMRALLTHARLPSPIGRVTVIACGVQPDIDGRSQTFRRMGASGEQPFWMPPTADAQAGEFVEDVEFRGLHPMIARRLQMWRLTNFEITRVASDAEVNLFECVARTNPADQRLIAVAEVRDLTAVFDSAGRVAALPEVEHVLAACLEAIRRAVADRPDRADFEWNRVMLYVWPVVRFPLDEVTAVAGRLAPLTEGLGIEQVVVQGRLAGPSPGTTSEVVLRLSYEAGSGLTIRFTEPPTEPMQPMDDYTQKVLQARRRGVVYPYELVPMLHGPSGTFEEHDFNESGVLAPVSRPPGGNRAGVIVGVVNTPTDRYPEGMTRVAVMGDPTKSMGSIAEAECRLLLAAVDLAEQMGVPIEWLALSAGARIAMDSGSENLDWVARVLRRLIEHTQRGGEVNVIVAGINVGAQPYWNAESTMLMHTRGILVMTPDSAMVLTGKQAIDYSGGVSADNNIGIGGYERIMGPNGEAQYWAADLSAACGILHAHYDLTYVAADERWPRRARTTDPMDRDVRTDSHVVEGSDFTTVGDVFSEVANPDRKKPFDIRTIMRATVDRDHVPLERWKEMADAETGVVYDARLGGFAVTMIGIESRPLPRHGSIPADGPGQWSAGTLFPLSSKKVARAINAASARRPVIILANLSGFDGSPDSLRRLQLEYGAEIGRAIVNFDGPIVLCVVSRYHGGAFVVFSATLNDQMEVLAVEGSYASVIGGAPAAAVVFTGQVNARTSADPRVKALEAAVIAATEEERDRLSSELAELTETVRVEKLGLVAAEFDAVHSVERALEVGSVHRIIPAARLRPALIEAVERGIRRASAR